LDEQLIRDITIRVLRETAQAKDMVPHAANHIFREPGEPAIPIGVSARHVHLCREHMDILFGAGSELSFYKELMGGQFASAEIVAIVGRHDNAILKARVLGPLRTATQAEVSGADSRNLGLLVPLRDSGDITGSAPITLIGPSGAVYLNEGCILARRHIHMSPADAMRFGVKDEDIVCVRVDGPKGGIFSDVLVRVNSAFSLEMHIDTDEANAFGILTGDNARIYII